MSGVPDQFNNDAYFGGTTTFGGPVVLPAACVGPNQIAGIGAGGITAQNLICHERIPAQLAATASTVAAVTEQYLFTAKAAGNLVDFRGVITGAIPIGAYGFTVDLLKSTGGGAPASVLTTKIIGNSSSTLLTAILASIASAAYAAGDSFFLSVALTGGSGTQAVGLGVTVMTAEQYL